MLPDVGEGLEEGEVVAWLVEVGDVVRRDQPVVEVQTDKATVELPAPVAGRVVRLAAEPGEIVKVGGLLVVIDPGTVVPPPPPPPPPAPAAAVTAPPAARPKASPAVRKLAAELGVDLAAIRGTGPGGRIVAGDVQAARGAPTPSATPTATPATALTPAAAGTQPLRGIRRLTAEAMTRSWSEIPHITVMDELDASALVAARRHLDGALGLHVTLGVLLMAAVARGLERHPMLNASLDAGATEFTVHPAPNVGLAVATERGLVVPVIRDAGRRSLPDLAAEVHRVTTAAREGTLGPADLSGGTFTVSNYGSIGGRFATPLIRPPEVGIMGFGAVRPRPIAIDGEVVARPTLPYSCSADHRLIDGDALTAFCEHVAGLLSEPVALLASFLAKA
jgi:pyruvate dehydrogenase E2 component (dihydrolipoamide acetyltransferase)